MKVIVFDLDDTLYYEIQFVESAFNYINRYLINRFDINIKNQVQTMIKNREFNLYDWIILNTDITNEDFPLTLFLNQYRYHFPSIKLKKGAEECLLELKSLKYKIGIITDGRSVTQRNKIKALGLEQYFEKIIISEETGFSKPHRHNFQLIEKFFSESSHFTYVGDNTSKDFEYTQISNKWNSVCLEDAGYNIHKQDIDSLMDKGITSVKNLKDIIKVI